MARKAKPRPIGTGGALERLIACRLIDADNTAALLDRQVNWIASRFGLPPAVARTVAELAYTGGAK